MKTFSPSEEQKRIFNFTGKNMVISASAGSGKTTTMIEYISRLVESGQPIKRVLVLTFTKAAASEMKDRLMLSLIEKSDNQLIQSQIDDLFVSDISTIHSFLEKIIKRNIGQFAFLEGFNILDEQQAILIKNEAIELAEQKFKEEKRPEFFDLNLTMRDKKLIRNIVFSMHDFMSAQADRDSVKSRFLDVDSQINAAKQILFAKINDERKGIIEKIDLFPRDNEKVEKYLSQIKLLLSQQSENLRSLSTCLALVNLPRQCVMTGYDKKQDVVEIKEQAQNLIKFAKKLNPEQDAVWDVRQTKKLTKELFDLYDFFEMQYSAVKQRANMLDFDDLEKYSETLLEDESVLKEIQENYDYVFIDEYQDTNPVQEKIVKLISQNGKFIAIGDPKQGIYAFRNATSKIILKDSQEFPKTEDGATEYLSSNYRSDKKILDFVNHTFVQIMTQKTTGIDYKTSSFLKGEKDNPKTTNPAVEILVTEKPKRERNAPAQDYDIYSDPLVCDASGEIEAKVVAEKIEEFLASEFVDPKTNQKRAVQPNDIAILSRSKSDVCDEIMNELRKRDLPFVSTLRSDFSSKAHTLLVINLLKLCLNKNDDIALASYLFSPLCLIDMDKLALLQGEGSFAEKVLSSQDEQIVSAIKRLDQFKSECLFLGVKKALEKLFIEKEFFIYLKTEIGENAVSEMLSLLGAIGGFENDKDIPQLVDYLQTPLTFSSVSGQNAITISTVHASKGLEYPIVFVVGLGKSIYRSDMQQFKISEDFGLGLMAYDEEKMDKFPSLQLVAARDNAACKERINELMVLYVALTRAKSHLIISGSAQIDGISDFSEDNFKNYSSFISLILSTNPQDSGAIVTQVDEVEEFEPIKKVVTPKNFDALKEKLQKYINFVYPYLDDTKAKQKASVTSLAHAGEEFVATDNNFALEGTAYHEAMRIIDFAKVETEKDVAKLLEENNFDEEYKKLVKNQIIFENIMLLKPFLSNKKIIKEKQFTMRLDLGEGARLVQGTVDLFLKGDKNILIDYKYTREKDDKVVLERYKKQLELYKKAIEEAEKITVDEVYLISLKNKKIIKY